MSRLNEAGLELARRMVTAPPAETAIPLDLFSADLPAVWLQKTCDGDCRLLLINWTDEAKEMRFDIREHGMFSNDVYDFWSNEPVPIRDGKLTALLNPRSCLYAVVRM